MMEKEKSKGIKKPVYISIVGVLIAVVLGIVIAVNCILVHWDSVLTIYLGAVGGGVSGGDTSVDTNYFKSDYESDEALAKAQKEFCIEMAGEGIVMLKNDGALPFETEKNISIFGVSSVGAIRSGAGSGAGTGTKRAWISSFESAGFEVNGTLVDFYANSGYVHGGGTASGNGSEQGDWKIAEVPQDKYTAAVNASYASYKEAAVVILSRGGGEGGDLPREMSRFGGDAKRHYLELTAEEDALLKAVKEAGFGKTLLIINAANPMELGFVNDPNYGIDACLWTSGLGNDGAEAIGKIVRGEINPSGRLVDTYVYDNMSAPAMQNFGDFRYVDADGELTGYSYVNYGEGIYVGYKYYETRYEDVVMETENVGTYDYENTVLYPFGYGLSYSNFVWHDFSCTVDGETVTVSVNVENNGTKPGKDVVQIYFQSPYTEYDIEYGIEKPAVSLVEFVKTPLIDGGDSATVSVSFSLKDMVSFDAYGAGTYILENGTYYITAAKNAHCAVNNILAAKGYIDGLSGESDASFVHEYVFASDGDYAKYDDGAGDEKITVKFADSYIKDYKYLSRSNWKIMDNGGLTYATADKSGVSDVTDANGTVGTVVVDAQTLAALKASGYAATGAPEFTGSADYTYGAKNGLELIDLKGLDYGDEKWDLILDELKRSEQHALFGKGGYGTGAIGTDGNGINKPKTYEYDAPSGISNFITGARAYGYPAEITLAATWNKELAERYGTLIGEDAIATQTSGWYAPAMNTHRTPFSGRNFEYYSEDSTLAGLIAEMEVKGVQAKGVYVYIKHFALNDQDTNRGANGGVATWSNEQAIREIYLKPFQYAVERGNAHGVMTAINRIGFRYSSNNYPLLTGVLRGEWGFEGAVVTDYTSAVSGAAADAILAAGVDIILCTSASKLTDAKQPWASAALRRATHNVLFVQANSLAMNGFAHGTSYSEGFPVYMILMIVADILVAAAVGWGIYLIVRAALLTGDKWQTRKRFSKRTNIIIVSVIGAALVALIIYFCVVWLPVIQGALLM